MRPIHAVSELAEEAAGRHGSAARATDIYTEQCSVNVNARDLAVMAATLPRGSVNLVPSPGAPGHDELLRMLRRCGHEPLRRLG